MTLYINKWVQGKYIESNDKWIYKFQISFKYLKIQENDKNVIKNINFSVCCDANGLDCIECAEGYGCVRHDEGPKCVEDGRIVCNLECPQGLRCEVHNGHPGCIENANAIEETRMDEET